MGSTPGGPGGLSFRLHSPNEDLALTFRKFNSVELRRNPEDYFRAFFADIENLPLSSCRDATVAEAKLARAGAALFEQLVPPDLRAHLWSLRHRIRTIRILTEDPWVPWELCRLTNTEGDESGFLCEEFALTRGWLGTHQELSLSMSSVALIVPSDSGLPYAEQEADLIESLSTGRRLVTRVVPGYVEVLEALASGTHDWIHFTGHGLHHERTDRSRAHIRLQGREVLSAQDVSGKIAQLGRAKPFVFFNACQVGRASMTLTEIGGFAKQFTAAGAAAFAGSYWSVHDEPAYEFAKALYKELLAGQALGVAVQLARRHIADLGLTRLAYVVHGNPLARLPS